MNKADIVNAVSEETLITKSDVERVLTSVLRHVVKAVSEGEKVILVDFGKFEQRTRKGRNGRNPRTGETIKIKPSIVPAFSAGKEFKDIVNR